MDRRSDEERIARILGEWLDRRQAGEDVPPERVIAANPDLAETLRARLGAVEMVDRTVRRSMDGLAGGLDRISDFELLREIGRGGMGVVYEAEQTSMGRRVALKVLSPAVVSSERAVKRFRREARATGRLHHTNIVSVHGMGRERGLWYYSMEFVEGRPLSAVIEAVRRGEMPFPEVRFGSRTWYRRIAEMAAGVAEALQAAHRQGVIHRDIKPSNLILDQDGVLKVMDFGLARMVGEGGGMTLTGDLVGTPLYMSPEQSRARRILIDHRTDLYSLGATLYELLTLSTPFVANDLTMLCHQVANVAPPRPRSRERRVPRDLETIVMKAMEKAPGDRYSTAGELAEDLRRYVAGAVVKARRIGPLGRAWRLARRRPVRAAVLLAFLALLGVAVTLGVRDARHARESGVREYHRLLAEADRHLFQAGLNWAADSQLAGAREVLLRATERMPSRPEAWLRLALVEQSSLETALSHVQRAADRGLSPKTAHLARAFCYSNLERWDEAAAEKRRAKTARGGGREDVLLEALLLEQEGRPEAGRRRLEPLVEQAAEGSAFRLLALHTRGMMRARCGEFWGALMDLAAVQQSGEGTPLLGLEIARLCRILGQEARAEATFDSSLDRIAAGADPDAWRTFLLGFAGRSGLHTWWGRATRRARESFPEDPWIRRERGRFLLAELRPEEVLELLPVTTEIVDRDPEDQLLRGEALVLLGELDRAFREARALLDAGVRSSSLEAHSVVTRAFAGRFLEARDLLDRALERDPDSAHLERAGITLALMRGEPEGGFGHAERLLSLRPCDGEARRMRAGLLRADGAESASREELREAVQRSPLSATPRVELAMMEWSEDPARAEARLRRGASLDVAPGIRAHLLEAWSTALADEGRFGAAIEKAREAVRVAPGSHHALQALGARLSLAGDGEALGALREAARLRPGCRTSLRALVAELLRADRRPEGFALADRAIDRGMVDGSLHLLRALCSPPDRDPLPDLRRATELEPGSPRIRMVLAQCLLQRGSEECVREAGRLARGLVEEYPEDANFQGVLAQALLAAGEPEKALERSRAALEEVEDHHRDLRFVHAKILQAAGHPEEALEFLKEVIAAGNPGGVGQPGTVESDGRGWNGPWAQVPVWIRTTGEVHLVRGRILMDLERFQEAIEPLRRAFEAAGEDDSTPLGGEAMARLVACWTRNPDSLERSRDLLAREEDDRVAWLLRAAALLSRASEEKALAFARRMLRRWPDDLTVAHSALRIFFRAGTVEDFERWLESFGDGRSGSALVPWARVVVCLKGAGSRRPRYLEALEAANRGIELAPDRSLFYEMKAQFLSRLDRTEEALDAIDLGLQRPALPQLEGVPIVRQDGGRHRIRARLRLAVGRFAGAEEDLRVAIERGAEDVETYTNLAAAILRQGRPAEALPWLEQAMRTPPVPISAELLRIEALLRLDRPATARSVIRRLPADSLPSRVRRQIRKRELQIESALGRTESLLARARKCRKEFPEEPGFLAREAEALVGMNRLSEAATLLEENRGPDHVHLVDFWYMVALSHLDRKEEALQFARGVGRQCPAMEWEMSIVLLSLGRFEEVRALAEADPGRKVSVPWAIYLSDCGRAKEALEVLREVDELAPSGVNGFGLRLRVLRGAGETETARKRAKSALKHFEACDGPLRMDDQITMAYVHAVAGDPRAADECLAKYDWPEMPLTHYRIARVHAVLGREDKALEYLGRARDAGLRIPESRVPDPDFGHLVEEPVYRSLLRE